MGCVAPPAIVAAQLRGWGLGPHRELRSLLHVWCYSTVTGLLMLRDTAKKLPLTDEQLRKVHERNAEADAKDAQNR